MNPAFFELIKNENLPKPLVVIKQIGKTCFLCAMVGVAILQLNQGKMGGTPLLDFTTWVTGWGAIVGFFCFGVVGIVALGKTSDNSILHAVGQTLKKLFLYMFLPALIITLILIVIFALPRYR